ncbi:winged helix-turn-helix transcriptional regulator [Paenibacillus methanolicus]|uniref:DNA-binding HxlR family transcriptional regulator n=1 Tax=Paenibacillus methanolicus TaxID=582686 RepID=A0A5S5CLP8_9BACL|nr:helix-turn-helix domain-containing protein [Paenibacillus methanolicus]TYP79625.1 DNA-binding HxlR family transcriptional regulator [Paenibacillus methanolicus]
MGKRKAAEPDISIAKCGYRLLLEIIGSKWAVLAIYAMEGGDVRYGEFLRRIEGISKKMLTQTLWQLERDGLLERDIHDTVPPGVEYRLTPLGRSLLVPLRHMKSWAIDHYPLVRKARDAFDQRADLVAGGETEGQS